MDKTEFNSIVMVLNNAYKSRNNGLMIESKEQANVWYSFLRDLDGEIAKKAIVNLVARMPWQPTIADIRNEYAALTNKMSVGEAEAWAMVRDGIRNGTYGATEEFAKFPDAIKRAVGNPMSLSEWAMMSSDDVETVIQSQFLRASRAALAEEKTERTIGQIGTRHGSMVEIAEHVANGLGVQNE